MLETDANTLNLRHMDMTLRQSPGMKMLNFCLSSAASNLVCNVQLLQFTSVLKGHPVKQKSIL